MGEADVRGIGRPLTIAIDPVAAKAAYETAPSPFMPAAIAWLSLALGCVALWCVASDVAHHRPFDTWWPQLGIGILFPITGMLQGRRPRPAFPLGASFSEAGVSFELHGTSRPLLVPWRRIRSIQNEADALSVTIADNAIMQRTYSLPKPADTDAVNEILALCYRHLVAPRGLHATPFDRLGIIANTAH